MSLSSTIIAESRHSASISSDVSDGDTASSSESVGSAPIRAVGRSVSVRHRWTSNWEFILFQLACFMTVEMFFIIPADIFDDDPTTFIHYVLFYIFLAIPVVYMQIIVGQYSQLGVIFFKYLTPIGHGIGLAMCINTFWSCIDLGVSMGDVSLYFLSAMKAELPWMKCPENEDKCWVSSGDCEENCFTKDMKLSALFFWREVYMANVDLEVSTVKYSSPILPRVVVVGLAWLVVYTITRLGIQKYRRIIRTNMYIAFVLLVLLFFVCIVARGGVKGLNLIITIDWAHVFYLKGWTNVIVDGTRLLGLSKACYVVHGSYMDSNTPSDVLTISFLIFHFMWTFFGSLLIFAGVGIIAERAYTPVAHVDHIFAEPVPLLVILPQSLGYLGAPQLWSTIYFLVCYLLLLNHQVIQIDIVERCITDMNSRLKQYSEYTIGALCLVGVFFGVILVSKDSFAVQEVINKEIVYLAEGIEVTLMCTLICWVYGVQNFSDDIHTMVGLQPAKYWKICWYVMPLFLWLSCSYVFYYQRRNHAFGFITFIFGLTYISPLPIMGTKAIFYHLKRHNLMGVIQAQERWGSPDHQERRLRHLFNPREETRSRRRIDFCKHKCFMKSKILKQAIEEQEEFVKMEEDYEMQADEVSDYNSESDEGF